MINSFNVGLKVGGDNRPLIIQPIGESMINIQVLKYFDVKINTYDQDGKPMKELAAEDVQTVLMRVEDELKENGSIDFQCETDDFVIDFENKTVTQGKLK